MCGQVGARDGAYRFPTNRGSIGVTCKHRFFNGTKPCRFQMSFHGPNTGCCGCGLYFSIFSFRMQ